MNSSTTITTENKIFQNKKTQLKDNTQIQQRGTTAMMLLMLMPMPMPMPMVIMMPKTTITATTTTGYKDMKRNDANYFINTPHEELQHFLECL